MSYEYYKNNQKNLFLNQKKDNKIPYIQYDPFGNSTSARINYHYRQKEKEKNLFINQNENKFNNNIFPSSILNNNVRAKEEENKKSFYENQNNNKDIKDNKYSQRNLLRNFSENNFQKKMNKYDSNSLNENKKSQEAKELMDNFDGKFFDTITNFNQGNKIKNENKIDEAKIKQTNLNHNRNFSYDKYNYYNKDNSNKRTTLQNTDYLYKNFFQNSFTNNIQRINPNELNQKDNYNLYNAKKPGNNYERNAFGPIKDNNLFEKRMKFQNDKVNYKIKNYSYFSLGGADISKRPKINQDSFLVKKDENNCIFGVFDGHGVDGHIISQSIKEYLNIHGNSNSFSSNEKIYSLFKSLSLSINSSLSLKAMDSGSTAVLTFVNNEKIICANVGDSRAILISENENKIIPLSRDHKPDLPEEKKRIIMSGGRVDKIFGMGPFRVWFKDADYPGLAMSRSIGDGYAHKIGVTDEPEIFEFNLNVAKPKAIILASDGVFEFVKNEEIKDIIGKYYYNMDCQACAKEIVEYSRKSWENSGFAIDDITCIVAFFEAI